MRNFKTREPGAAMGMQLATQPLPPGDCQVLADLVLRDVIDADLVVLFNYQADPDACRMASLPLRSGVEH